MKPFENILILSDLDNTFLGDHTRLVPENLSAIEHFQALGGHFSFATGRDPYALLGVLPEADRIANAPCIVTNGAYLYDFQTKKTLDEHPLKREKLLPILEKLLPRHPDVSLRFSSLDGFVTPRLTEVLQRDLKIFLPITAEIPLDRIPDDLTLYKVVFHAEPEALAALQRDLEQEDLEDFDCYYSCPVLMEILDKEGTKGKRIPALAASMPHKPFIYGVGDYENDTELLLGSDCPCCPDNAMQGIKDISKVILCDHDLGAIADLIGRIEQAKGGKIQ